MRWQHSWEVSQVRRMPRERTLKASTEVLSGSHRFCTNFAAAPPVASSKQGQQEALSCAFSNATSTSALRFTRTFLSSSCCMDLGPLEAWPTGKPGCRHIVDALVAALPSLQEHGCSYREAGGLIRRMREGEGTWLGHVFEHVAIELQNIAGEDVTFGKTRSVDGRPGVYTVVYEYAQRDEGIEAGELAIQLLCSLLPAELQPEGVVPADFDWAEGARPTTSVMPSAARLGPSTASAGEGSRGTPHSVAAAERTKPDPAGPRQVPAAHPGHRHRAAPATSRWSWRRTRKRPTRSWRTAACRCRRQELVRSADRAVRAAERLGYPVVTKPYNGNHGRGISIDLKTA